VAGQREGASSAPPPGLPAGPSGGDGVSIHNGAGFHGGFFSFVENQTFSLPLSKHRAAPTLTHLVPAWWLRTGDGAEVVKGARWELQQLPARTVFRLAAFPGIVLSKQEGWEQRRGLPLIGDVALKPPHRSDVPQAPAHGPAAAPCPRGFDSSLVPLRGHSICPSDR